MNERSRRETSEELPAPVIVEDKVWKIMLKLHAARFVYACIAHLAS